MLAGPEHLERDQEARFCHYFMDKGRWHALEAIAQVASNYIHAHGGPICIEDIDASVLVPAPWWAVHAAFIAVSEWEQDQSKDGNGARIRLGQAFEIERQSRGEPSPYEKSIQDWRDRELALLVARMVLGHDDPGGRKAKVEFAKEEVAKRFGLSTARPPSKCIKLAASPSSRASDAYTPASACCRRGFVRHAD